MNTIEDEDSHLSTIMKIRNILSKYKLDTKANIENVENIYNILFKKENNGLNTGVNNNTNK